MFLLRLLCLFIVVGCSSNAVGAAQMVQKRSAAAPKPKAASGNPEDPVNPPAPGLAASAAAAVEISPHAVSADSPAGLAAASAAAAVLATPAPMPPPSAPSLGGEPTVSLSQQPASLYPSAPVHTGRPQVGEATQPSQALYGQAPAYRGGSAVAAGSASSSSSVSASSSSAAESSAASSAEVRPFEITLTVGTRFKETEKFLREAGAVSPTTRMLKIVRFLLEQADQGLTSEEYKESRFHALRALESAAKAASNKYEEQQLMHNERQAKALSSTAAASAQAQSGQLHQYEPLDDLYTGAASAASAAASSSAAAAAASSASSAGAGSGGGKSKGFSLGSFFNGLLRGATS